MNRKLSFKTEYTNSFNESKVEQLPAVLDAKRIAEIKQLCADILVDEQILIMLLI